MLREYQHGYTTQGCRQEEADSPDYYRSGSGGSHRGNQYRAGETEAGGAGRGSFGSLSGYGEAWSHAAGSARVGYVGSDGYHAHYSHHRGAGATHSDPARNSGQGRFAGDG